MWLAIRFFVEIFQIEMKITRGYFFLVREENEC